MRVPLWHPLWTCYAVWSVNLVLCVANLWGGWAAVGAAGACLWGTPWGEALRREAVWAWWRWLPWLPYLGWGAYLVGYTLVVGLQVCDAAGYTLRVAAQAASAVATPQVWTGVTGPGRVWAGVTDVGVFHLARPVYDPARFADVTTPHGHYFLGYNPRVPSGPPAVVPVDQTGLRYARAVGLLAEPAGWPTDPVEYNARLAEWKGRARVGAHELRLLVGELWYEWWAESEANRAASARVCALHTPGVVERGWLNPVVGRSLPSVGEAPPPPPPLFGAEPTPCGEVDLIGYTARVGGHPLSHRAALRVWVFLDHTLGWTRYPEVYRHAYAGWGEVYHPGDAHQPPRPVPTFLEVSNRALQTLDRYFTLLQSRPKVVCPLTEVVYTPTQVGGVGYTRFDGVGLLPTHSARPPPFQFGATWAQGVRLGAAGVGPLPVINASVVGVRDCSGLD